MGSWEERFLETNLGRIAVLPLACGHLCLDENEHQILYFFYTAKKPNLKFTFHEEYMKKFLDILTKTLSHKLFSNVCKQNTFTALLQNYNGLPKCMINAYI